MLPTNSSVTAWRGMDADHRARLTRAERLAAGKAARTRAPRSSHGQWTPAADRPDPIALLESQGETRVDFLLPLRYARMAATPFAFLRGSAIVMAQDLANTPTSGIAAQICGDAHIANFGAYASPERRVVFDLNDFDESSEGPWEWDVKRLVASTVMAGRALGFSQGAIAGIVAQAVEAYREKMWEYSEENVLDVWYERVELSELVQTLSPSLQARLSANIERAQKRGRLEAFSKMTEAVDGTRRFKETPPTLMHVAIKGENDTIRGAFESYRDSLPYERRVLLDRYRFVDIALKVVGVGSVGTRCFAVLLDAGEDQDPLLLQIKEANASVLEKHLGASPFLNHGQRVVVGQRLMQATTDIFLGWLRNEANGMDYYVRQLRDMKFSADLTKMNVKVMTAYVRLCASVLARAHARTSDPAMLAGYMGKSDILDQALVKFAFAYADQTERDHAALLAAIKQGRLQAQGEQGEE